jgi:hypothetical protein
VLVVEVSLNQHAIISYYVSPFEKAFEVDCSDKFLEEQ